MKQLTETLDILGMEEARHSHPRDDTKARMGKVTKVGEIGKKKALK